MAGEEAAREYWRPKWDDLWRRATLYAGGGRETRVTPEEVEAKWKGPGQLTQQASWYGAKVRYSLAERHWLVWWPAGSREPGQREAKDEG